jgi:Na+-transporting NADH:ubiquinone oxidoreductase subunit NqrE
MIELILLYLACICVVCAVFCLVMLLITKNDKWEKCVLYSMCSVLVPITIFLLVLMAQVTNSMNIRLW